MSTALRFGMVGSGAWGTAIAMALAHNGHFVRLWCRTAEKARSATAQRTISQLPDIRLPASLAWTHDLADLVANSDILVLAIPSDFLRILEGVALPGHVQVVSLIKGVLPAEDSFEYVSSFVERQWGKARPFAVLSGPNLAGEIARGLPAATVIASSNSQLASVVQQAVCSDSFRAYTSGDVRGVEIGGVLKNMYAIAAGICDGLELGMNAKAALISRSLIEMMRFAQAGQAKSETLMGLSGLGDLILTCSAMSSRNWKVGYQLGRGYSVADSIASVSSVAEGVKTTRLVTDYVLKHGISMPIAGALFSVLVDHAPPEQVIRNLMGRDLKPE